MDQQTGACERQLEVLELLSRECPRFQLKPGQSGLRSAENFLKRDEGADTQRFERASAALPLESLRLLGTLLDQSHRTLEVGGGHSTVVFAEAVNQHICVNPDKTANQLIREFMQRHDLRSDNVRFIEASSDHALPRLEVDGPIDVALLDGNHSFPFPMLEWHYIDRHLVKGSHLVLDNVEVSAVRMLTHFLDTEPAYQRVDRVTGHHRYDCFVYEKVEDEIAGGWQAQAINHSSLLSLFWDVNLTRMWRPLQRLRQRLRKT